MVCVLHVLFDFSLRVLAGAVATAAQVKSKGGVALRIKGLSEFDEHPVRAEAVGLIGVDKENTGCLCGVWRHGTDIG